MRHRDKPGHSRGLGSGELLYVGHVGDAVRLLDVLLEVEAVPVCLVAHAALVGPDVLMVIEMTLITILSREALLAVFTVLVNFLDTGQVISQM